MEIGIHVLYGGDGFWFSPLERRSPALYDYYYLIPLAKNIFTKVVYFLKLFLPQALETNMLSTISFWNIAYIELTGRQPPYLHPTHAGWRCCRLCRGDVPGPGRHGHQAYGRLS